MFSIIATGNTATLEEDLSEAIKWIDGADEDEYFLPAGKNTKEGDSLYIAYRLSLLYDTIGYNGRINWEDFKASFFSSVRQLLISKMESEVFVVDKGFIRFMEAYIRVRRYDESIEQGETENTFLAKVFSALEKYISLKEELSYVNVGVFVEDFETLLRIVEPNKALIIPVKAKAKAKAKPIKKSKLVDDGEDFDDE